MINDETYARVNSLLEGLDKDKTERKQGRYSHYLRVELSNPVRNRNCWFEVCCESDVCFFGETKNVETLSYTGTIRELESFLDDYRKKK